MPRYRTRYRVTITAHDLGAFLDMLRYDCATVEAWSGAPDPTNDPRARFTVSLSAENPQPGRWASFGIAYTEREP
jgi:hypothetical protein